VIGDVGGIAETCVGTLEVAGADPLHPSRQEQIASLNALTPAVIEQPPRPGDPAGTAGTLALLQETEGQPECAARRTFRQTAGDELLMRARPDGSRLIVFSDEIRGGR
jgi:hypothetical protein